MRLSDPVAEPKPDISKMRRALASLLNQRFDAGQVRGTKKELGELLGATGAAAKTKASRLLAGEQFPDQHWEAIASFLGLSPARLLRELAEEWERLEDE